MIKIILAQIICLGTMSSKKPDPIGVLVPYLFLYLFAKRKPTFNRATRHYSR